MPKRWNIAPAWSGRTAAARGLGVSPLISQLLHNRGLADTQSARTFLHPELKSLLGPELLPGAVEAAALIAKKIRERKRIVIYGDYDVDGITGAAILWRLLTLAKAEVSFYIPHRIEEGYGVNGDALRQLRRDGADTVITVDCGITAVEDARTARDLGLTFIVTDHHTPGPVLPDAAMIVHPSVGGQYPNPNLCGSGVAFKLAWAIAKNLCNADRVSQEFREFLLDAICLASLGTIADVVSLTGENRIIARFGLVGLKETKLVGLRALIESARLNDEKRFNAEHVGFGLAPRINAAGRMGHAQLAVELLTRADESRAKEIASYLEEQNRGRQAKERKITHEACELIDAGNLASDARRAIVAASDQWHPGVIGIVASRIVERYHRPAILVALDNGEGQGSGRSIKHFQLHQALTDCSAHLITFGGHAMAAGLRIKMDRLDEFTEAFVGRANQLLTAQDLEPALNLDAEVVLDELTEPFVRELETLSPFGIGNPKPKFATGMLRLDGEPRAVGKNGEHIQMQLTDGRTRRKAIAFRQKELLGPLLDHRRCRVAFEPILNTFNGRTSVELRIIDVAFPEKSS